MVQELLPLMPSQAGTVALTVAIIGMIAGAVLWLFGSRFSRSLVTLSAVSVGAMIGTHLPRWAGWPIDGMAPGIVGAIVMGVSAFLFHRFWVGVGLGLVLACWAALAVWILAHDRASWSWPAVDASTTLPSFLQDTWHTLPEAVTRILPWACGVALLSGICFAMMWPKLGTIALYSIVGTTLLVLMGMLALDVSRPEWLEVIVRSKPQLWPQAVALAVIVLIGAAVQWWTGPAKRASAASPPPQTSKGAPS